MSQIVLRRVVAVINQDVHDPQLPESADSVRAVFGRPRGLLTHQGVTRAVRTNLVNVIQHHACNDPEKPDIPIDSR